MNSAGPLSTLDWLAIGIIVFSPVLVGFWLRSRASKGGVAEFFVAGRDMKWWLLGTSIVATTFSVDTPLAITGWIAKYGIAGNWFWWSYAISSVALVVFFARRWRLSGVVTDAEIVELRYGGRAAVGLRTAKASINAFFLNPVILGWVFAAMAKFSEPFIDWRFLLGSGVYAAIEEVYPVLLLFGTLDTTITVWVLLGITLLYSTLGGLRAVIFTDFVQFVIQMVMSITLSWLAARHIGGIEEMWGQLAELYPEQSGPPTRSVAVALSHIDITAFAPSFGNGVVGSLGIPFSAFLLTLGMLWWTSNNVDGSGYIAQRLYSAKDGSEAEKGALWFAIANFVGRSWPWVVAGVAALVIYPRADVQTAAKEFTACIQDEVHCSVEMAACLDNRFSCAIPEYGLLRREFVNAETLSNTDEPRRQVFVEDRERSYPSLINDIMPIGLKGLAIAAMMAAFMSTVSTHIN